MNGGQEKLFFSLSYLEGYCTSPEVLDTFLLRTEGTKPVNKAKIAGQGRPPALGTVRGEIWDG